MTENNGKCIGFVHLTYMFVRANMYTAETDVLGQPTSLIRHRGSA